MPKRKAPSPVWLLHPTSPPKGEVKKVAGAGNHLSLGGEVGAQRRVRGPCSNATAQGPLTGLPATLSPEGRGLILARCWR
jgi:hypothetical protein